MKLTEKTKLQNANTMLTITVGFILLFVIFKLKWMLITALGIGAAGLFSEPISHYISLGWLKLSHLLGFIMPNVLLAIVYFIFLMPIAFLSRIGKNKDKLMLKGDVKSTFTDHQMKFTPDVFEKTW
jgi:hypothetical protein